MENKKKLLYYFWGYLHDKVSLNNIDEPLSSPDGNFFYSWSIIGEFQERGWDVYGIIDRDKEYVEKYGKEAFRAFSKEKRYNIYKKMKWLDLNKKEDFDLILIEWRFLTKDNSKLPGEEGYSPDLIIQNKILDLYKETGVKIVIFDLDYKILPYNESMIRAYNKFIIETSTNPYTYQIPRFGVFIPFDFKEFNQFSTQIPYSDKLLVYIGNNYERDDDLNNKLIPLSNLYPKKVHVYGNWMKEELKNFREKNNNIIYNSRIGANQFRKVLSRALAAPLLAKKEYKEKGYMTARILETLFWGSIPIGFSDFKDINLYLPQELIIDMNDFENSSKKVIEYLSVLGLLDRMELRQKIISNLSKFMDVKCFVNKILELK